MSAKTTSLSVRVRRLLAVAVLLCASCVAGCGGSSNPVVASVGDSPITKAMLDHWVAIGLHEAGGNTPAHHGPELTRRELTLQTLRSLISFEWVTKEAEALGLGPSEEEVRRTFAREKKSNFPKQSELDSYLKRSGQTVADLLLSVRLSLASERIFEHIKSSAVSLAHPQFVKYYDENMQRFLVPERRNVESVRTWTKAAIIKAAREIRSGASFASVADRVSINVPDNKRGGVTLGLQLGTLEKGLDEAVFTAKPDVLVGPLHLRKRYYIFEVTKIIGAHQAPLAQVESSIAKELPAELETQARAIFIKEWRAQWRSKTSCEPGYVVEKCREYPSPPAEDLTALS